MKTKIYRVYSHDGEGFIGCIAYFYNKENAIKRLKEEEQKLLEDEINRDTIFNIDEHYIEDEKEQCDGLDCAWCTNPDCPKENK